MYGNHNLSYKGYLQYVKLSLKQLYIQMLCYEKYLLIIGTLVSSKLNYNNLYAI